MPKITFKEAKQFLDKIQANDTVAIIHHDDVDGFAAGIIFRSFCQKKGAKTKNLPFTLGSNQQNILKQTKDYNKVLIADLAPNTILNILQGFDGKEVMYTDHHQDIKEKLPKNIKEYRTITDGYIPSSRTAYELTGELYWLAVCGTIADAGERFKENKIFLDNFFGSKKISLERFKKDVIFLLSSVLIYFHGKNQKVLKKLVSLESYADVKKLKKYARSVDREIEKCTKDFKKNHEQIGIAQFYLFKPKYQIKSVVTTKISLEHPNEVYVIGTIEGNTVRLSARNSNSQYNMIELLQAGIKGLENAGAGGHIPAAGGHIQKKDLAQFKENLKNYL